MSASTSPEVARAARAAKQEAARQALLVWQDAVLDALEVLAARAGVAGDDLVIVFTGTDTSDPDPDDLSWEPCPELCRADLASARGQARLGADAGAGARWLWVEAVTLWDELRTAISQAYGTEVPLGLVLDVDRRVLYCFEEWFCPEVGAEPVEVFELGTAGAPEPDPFAALMAAAEVDLAAIDRRLEDLLDRYQLAPPSVAGHDAGDCDIP